ncbi:MAG: hypothetical protein AB7V27_07760 [Candidatus Binatia bacterium]
MKAKAPPVRRQTAPATRTAAKYRRWEDLNHRMTPEQRAERDRAIQQKALEMQLDELRRRRRR